MLAHSPAVRDRLRPTRAVVNGAGWWYLIAMIPAIDLGPYLAARPRDVA